MNILSALIGAVAYLTRLIDPESANEDSTEYSIDGLWMSVDLDDEPFCRGKSGKLYNGKVKSSLGNDRVVVNILTNHSSEELDNILREYHISNLIYRLSEPNTVLRVCGVMMNANQYSVAYPYMDCGSYHDFAMKMGTKLAISDKIEISKTIAGVLADIHFAGILHCDIGARNIFISRRPSVNDESNQAAYHYHLGDFREAHIGDSKSVDPHQPTNIRWLAPEVFRTTQLNATTDVFAFGITLYEIFSNNLPYYSMSPKEIRAKLIVGQKIRPVIDDRIPRQISKLMQCCWRSEPSERPTMDGVWLRLNAIDSKSNQIRNHSK